MILGIQNGADYLKAFEPNQLHALILLLNANTYGPVIWVAFFGLHRLILGYLLYNSDYFPKILGILMVFASLGYLTARFGNFLSPNYEEGLSWIVFVTAFIGEVLFFIWLLFKGVNIQNWKNRIHADQS